MTFGAHVFILFVQNIGFVIILLAKESTIGFRFHRIFTCFVPGFHEDRVLFFSVLKTFNFFLMTVTGLLGIFTSAAMQFRYLLPLLAR